MRYGGGPTLIPADVPCLFLGVLQKLDESYRDQSGGSYLPPQPSSIRPLFPFLRSPRASPPTCPRAPRRPAHHPSASLVSAAGSGGQRLPPTPPMMLSVAMKSAKRSAKRRRQPSPTRRRTTSSATALCAAPWAATIFRALAARNRRTIVPVRISPTPNSKPLASPLPSWRSSRAS